MGTSRIVHFLVKDGGGTDAPTFTLYTGPYWEGMSDHRPLLCWVSGPSFIQLDPGTQKPRPPPMVVRKHGLKKEDRKTIDAYITELRKLNMEDKIEVTADPVLAATTLRRLPKNGVKAIPKKELSALHQKFFVDCWSPTMVALDAHLHMVTEVANHLNGLGKKEWWKTTEEQGRQIRQLADKWESTVRGLEWHGAIPQRAWAGRSPQDWRANAEDNPVRLLQLV